MAELNKATFAAASKSSGPNTDTGPDDSFTLPLLARERYPFAIDGEQVLLTGLGGGNLNWTVQRGMGGTTPTPPLTGTPVTALMPVRRLFASVVAGQTGKCYFGCASLNKATMAGVIKEFWPTGGGGGVDDTFSLRWWSANGTTSPTSG